MVALNYTNRYCKHCDLLIAHKDEVESLLTDLFASAAPELVGNDYLIFATMEKNAWRDNMHSPRAPMEMLDHIHDFKSYTELRMTRGGWYPEGVEPPEWTPPASERWVKEK